LVFPWRWTTGEVHLDVLAARFSQRVAGCPSIGRQTGRVDEEPVDVGGDSVDKVEDLALVVGRELRQFDAQLRSEAL
jgi:hypothetical protein